MTFNQKLSLWIALSFFSTLLLLPLPFAKVYITTDDNFINPKKKPVEFKTPLINFPTVAGILLGSIDIPSNIKYYDLHITNVSSDYDWEFQWPIDKNDPILSYLTPKLFSSSTIAQETTLIFPIKPKTSITSYAIPIQIIPSNTGGLVVTCGFDPPAHCPSSPVKQINEKTLKIYAVPNLFSWIIQLVLIWSFWMVIVQTLSEFFKKK